MPEETKMPEQPSAVSPAVGSNPPKEPGGLNNAQTISENSTIEGLIFNVMPKMPEGSGLVDPQIKIENSEIESANGEQNAGLGQIIKKYKYYVIAVPVLLIVGAIIYFAATKFSLNSYKEEQLLAKNPPPAKTPPKPSAPTSSPTSLFSTPQAWRDKYFPNCNDQSLCGDSADPDHDGLSNAEEFKAGTDPNNPDSDRDGLADGDEVHIFGSSPTDAHTAKNAKYSDADYAKGAYDLKTDKKMTPAQIQAVTYLMAKFGLHEPSITTLGSYLKSIYNFTLSSASSTPPSLLNNSTTTQATDTPQGLDQSVEAKQDRDSQRTNTIKGIEAGLVKFWQDNKTYPQSPDFATMYLAVKPYLKVATDPLDPVNKPPYVYSYMGDGGAGKDFTLSFFSEVAGLEIKKHAADAVKDAAAQQAAIYDEARKNDLDSLRTALLLYSQKNIAGNQDYVFPTTDKYKTALVPDYISQIPKDPKTGADYQYQVSGTFSTFTLKAVLDNPDPGTTGYLCNQDECKSY